MLNPITDVEGLRVGLSQDVALASGVMAVLFGDPALASIGIGGCASLCATRRCLNLR